MDFGLHHAPVLWIEVAGRNAFVFAELDARGQDLHATAEDILRVDAEFGLAGVDVEMFIDPAGLGTSYQTGKTDADVLREHGIQVANMDNRDRYDRATRTGFLKYMLRTRRLWISRDCLYLIDAFERAQWDRVGGTGALKDSYRKDGLWDHPLDALGEALIRLFPSFGAAAVESVGGAVLEEQFAAGGGSEFG